MDKKIKGGVYLVIDPVMDEQVLLEKVTQALEGGVQVLQIWNHWPEHFALADKQALVEAILKVSRQYHVPTLINEAWELLQHTALDGVHFDSIPEDYENIKKEVGRLFVSGITCSNDLAVITWAEKHKLDYVSFCSMFPSSSVDSCEIVRPETVKSARAITQMPIFLSGGITTGNLATLEALDFNGVAVISGILSADSPKASAASYQNALQTIK
ncbi:thiamine-phosphate pyrophosphorylase [Catalinimonas alkaloidigena]|uniref:thiamine phosphate synthase n=1 Tax=Catalinimonas alkaloidigena TaxID=1075417 RepID=UPI002404E9FB|nr:thiamine phosphate synthase [Catalinimonas alkaloidigena]MDF9794895.1 thiamine-phosphate pyrophosphorylase [Catalinimonas alkaloidigena]